MERYKIGWRLGMRSWAVLMLEPQLLLLPLLAGAAGLVAFAALGLPALALADSAQHPGVLSWALYAACLFVVVFIASMCAAAVAAGALQRLETGQTSVRAAFDAAWARRSQLAEWAALSTLVGLAVRAIEERFGLIGRIIGSIVNISWGIASAFAIPVILIEGVGARDALKRSGQIVRERWGQAVGSVIAVDVILLPWLFVLVIGSLVLFASGLFVVGILLLAVGIIAYVVVGTTVTAIARVLLYRYATTGDPAGIGETMAMVAFRPRRQRKLFGR